MIFQQLRFIYHGISYILYFVVNFYRKMIRFGHQIGWLWPANPKSALQSNSFLASYRVVILSRPSHGGSYCLGERRRHKICNSDACPEDTLSFRHQQCAEFNTISYKNEKHEWEPLSQARKLPPPPTFHRACSIRLISSSFFSFEAGIAHAISSFKRKKWRNKYH